MNEGLSVVYKLKTLLLYFLLQDIDLLSELLDQF